MKQLNGLRVIWEPHNSGHIVNTLIWHDIMWVATEQALYYLQEDCNGDIFVEMDSHNEKKNKETPQGQAD